MQYNCSEQSLSSSSVLCIKLVQTCLNCQKECINYLASYLTFIFIYLLYFVTMVPHFLVCHSSKVDQLWIRKMIQHKKTDTQNSTDNTNIF